MDIIPQAIDLFLKNCFTSLLPQPQADFGSRMAEVYAACTAMLSTIVPQFLQTMDESLALDEQRRKEWTVVRADTRTLVCVFGEIRFRRRYYRHKKSGEMAYLLDRFLGIEAYAKVNGDTRQKAIVLAEQDSYARSAEGSTVSGISRMSVCNYVGHLNRFPELKAEGEKRSVKYLYVEADEDHTSLQNGKQAQIKLVYIHEGVEMKGGRRALVRPRYLTWPSGESTDTLWETVSGYIEQQYVPEDIEEIFLSGDAGSWIRKGEEWLYPCIPVLDGFHTAKAVKRLFGAHAQRASEFMGHVWQDELEQARELCRKQLLETPEPRRAAKQKQANYLLNNFRRILNQRHPGAQGCSAEGHVSHILSDRLSSRPLGWSVENMENIAQLRVMKANGQVIRYGQLRRNDPPPQTTDSVCKADSFVTAKSPRVSLRAGARSSLDALRQTLPILTNGATNSLYQVLHALSYDSFAS